VKHFVTGSRFAFCSASGIPLWLAHQIGRCRIDDELVFYGRAAEQHPETHRITVSERDLGRPGFVTEGDGSFYYIPLLAMPTRVSDNALVEHVRSANALTIRTSLQRMDTKANALFAVHLEWFEKKGV